MNKVFLLFLSAFFLTFSLVSCADDNEEPTNNTETPGGDDDEEIPYSELTPEEQKERLQSDAIGFISALEGLTEEPGYKTMEVFSSLMETNPISLQSGILRNASSDIFYINDFHGKYTWDSDEQKWNREPNDGSIIFEFPTTTDGNTNTEKIEISGVASEYYASQSWTEWEDTGKYEERDGYPYPIYNEYEYTESYQLPKSLTGSVTSNGKSVASISANSDLLNNDQLPTTGTLSFIFGSYKMEFSANAKDNNTATFSLKKENTSLLSMTANLNGNAEKIYNKEGDAGNGNFKLIIMGKLALQGNMNKISEFTNKSKALDKQYDVNNYRLFGLDDSSEKYNKAQCNLVDQYGTFALISTDDTTKIADMKMKAIFSETYEDHYFYYQDYNTGKYYDYIKEVYLDKKPTYFYTYTYWESVPVLYFNDDTSIEASVYFSKGFDELLDRIDEFMSKFGWSFEDEEDYQNPIEDYK